MLCQKFWQQKTDIKQLIMNFIDKKVSVQQTIETLGRQGIHVDDDEEATIILDFLYLMSKNYKKIQEDENTGTLRGTRTSEEINQTEN